MDKEQKEKELKKELTGILRESFSDEELKEMKNFFTRIAELLVEAYLDGDLS